MQKTLSAKIDDQVLAKLDEVCERRHLVKAKVLEEAIREKLEHLAEEDWAIAMLAERASSKELSLEDVSAVFATETS